LNSHDAVKLQSYRTVTTEMSNHRGNHCIRHQDSPEQDSKKAHTPAFPAVFYGSPLVDPT